MLPNTSAYVTTLFTLKTVFDPLQTPDYNKTFQRLRQTFQTPPPNMNIMAYEMVKDKWTKKGIWNKKWGVLPGMSWKHEKPLEEMIREEMGGDAFSPQADTLDRPPSPTDLIYVPLFDGLQTSSAEPPSTMKSIEMPNSDDNQSPIATNSGRRLEETQEDFRSSPRRMRRQGNRKSSIQGEQPPQIECNALGPVHLSKVSKACRKRGPSLQRRRQVYELPFNAQKPLNNVDFPSASTESSPVPPRRSRRLEEVERKKITDSTDIAAVDLRNGHPQSQPRRARAGPKTSNSAKRQGISKTHANAARHRAK